MIKDLYIQVFYSRFYLKIANLYKVCN